MVDSEGFVKAGWVQDLRLLKFGSTKSQKFIIMGKVWWYIIF